LRLILIGPPGSGKGTQAKMLADEKGLMHISTGDMLREAIAEGTDAGLRAKAAVEQGHLVDDDLLFEIVRDQLGELGKEQGFILDGFPRNLAQARFLDELLRQMGIGIDAVLLMDVPDETVIRRLSGRRVCSQCGKEYHVEFSPPRTPGVCDLCGGALFQREDDRPEKVARRLEVYKEMTLPLREFYRRNDALITVDAEGDIQEVYGRICESLCSARD